MDLHLGVYTIRGKKALQGRGELVEPLEHLCLVLDPGRLVRVGTDLAERRERALQWARQEAARRG